MLSQFPIQRNFKSFSPLKKCQLYLIEFPSFLMYLKQLEQ